MAKTPPFPELDPGHKRTTWETIVVTTPVILTVVATILAGLSSSEMSSSQYYRSLAAQMQSKVSDQWDYFQAKKLRAEQCGNTVAILQGISHSMPIDQQDAFQITSRLIGEMQRVITHLGNVDRSVPAASGVITELGQHAKGAEMFLSQLSSATTRPDRTSVTSFLSGDVPDIQEQPIANQQIANAMRAVDSHVPEADLERQAGQIPQEDLDQAISTANENAAAFDRALDAIDLERAQVKQSIDGISRESAAFEQAARQAPDEVVAIEPANSLATIHDLTAQLSTAVSVAGLNFNSNRYQREARYNQVLADLLEIQVRRQGFLSDRYRIRSKEFFYGMLGAQAGVTIATFSLAVRRRNLLWGLAASAGLAAVTFAAYVYMFV
jgi:hypothetical protein